MSIPRTARLAEQIRTEASEVLAREVHDPGVGFVTVTRADVTADLQLARLYYTMLGDAASQKATERALARITPFVRRQLGARLRLRRVPELRFVFDRSVACQARVEEILQELHAADSPPPDDVREAGFHDSHDD